MTINAEIFQNNDGLPITHAPYKPPDCSGIDGWWLCLDDTAQAIIVAAGTISLALILSVLIIRIKRRKQA